MSGLTVTKAIVVGGGIAGMCAAQVLAEHVDEVVLLERDQYPKGSDHRRGVPQSKMFHTLLERGRRDIEAIFPRLPPAFRISQVAKNFIRI